MKYPLVVTCPQPLLTAVCKYSSGTPLLPLVSAGFMCEDENPVCLCQGHVTSIWPSERGASLHLTWISQKEKKQISITEHIYVESRKIVWRRQWRPTPVLLPGKSHGQRSLVGGCPWGREESDMTERLHFHFSLLCIGAGNGNLLQCSCLENPRDRGAWWAAIYGVAQSRTRLKWPSSSSRKSVQMILFAKQK